MSEHATSDESPADEEFYRRLCRHGPVALIATDTSFRVVVCNEAAGRLVGTPPEGIVGRQLVEIAPEGRRGLFERTLRRTVERGLSGQFQLRLPGSTGEPRDLMVLLSAVPGSEGAPIGVAAWIIDETDRKRLAERLTQAERMASLGTLAGGVAHHFNNILGGVATFVDFALSSGDAASMRRALQMTADAAARASRITQSLLTFAEHEARSGDLADLTEIALTFVNLVERSLEQRNINLRLDLHPVPVVAVQASQMHHVLRNLLANAEDAMPDGGTITIRVDRAGDDVRLCFADTGCGIRAEDTEHVFEPFFTTKGALAGGDKGNPGLGLSVVHGLVREMGGRIRLQSMPSVGSEFVVSLPIPEKDESTGGPEQAEQQGGPS